ncbi:putative enoyl-acyl carrier reductase [Neospora caninum Liverpool]|uniref:Putative enoyl-acyl carrier reductase n=1 Tax=Neospora caninum (strain Liverpool) TaxID=572307 RepID=F0VRC4_NEOCL|nr:putative enoyl-acyl carrier reductase [Neospora caninum Liverpool]CBZ56272.1 putative enoyl-acyl carrier reductase [Neospora caninum Liverpool]|eukprot:XP_003886297.1 putative enoyl-acyl carrier reductase [Neospora caninum Liverpool]
MVGFRRITLAAVVAGELAWVGPAETMAFTVPSASGAMPVTPQSARPSWSAARPNAFRSTAHSQSAVRPHSAFVTHAMETADATGTQHRAAGSAGEGTAQSAFAIDLTGKTAFVAGVADSQGYGWAIAKHLASAGARVALGTWPPVLGLFQKSLQSGRLDEDRKLPDGSLLEFAGVYALDAAFDKPEDVPQDVTKPLLETSRKGYLAASSNSAYSFVSLLQHFGPIMNEGGSAVTLSYLAAERVVPGKFLDPQKSILRESSQFQHCEYWSSALIPVGYGGGMSSAKAALESDTRTLAWEAGQKYGVRVNAISAGPLKSRAASAIGKSGEKTFIDYAIDYSYNNAPLRRDLYSDDVGGAALFLLSPLARAVSGVTLYVDNGLHAMGQAVDSRSMPPLQRPAE